MYASLLLASIAGLGIGIISGLLGIGGGLITIPLLRLGLGAAELTASATSLFTVIPTSISGTIGHIKTKTINCKMGLIIGLSGACLSPLGALLGVKAGGFVVMMAVVCVVIYTAYTMLKKYVTLKAEAGLATSEHDAVHKAEAGLATSEHDAAQELVAKDDSFAPAKVVFDVKTVGRLILAGMIVGLASGFLGLGGGFIIVPLTTWLFGITMKEATGTSLMAISILALPGVITQAILGNIAFDYGIAVVLGSIPGAFIGGLLIPRVKERYLRLLFGLMLICVGVLLIVNETSLL